MELANTANLEAPGAAKMLAFATSMSSEALPQRPTERVGVTDGCTDILRPSAVNVEGELLTKTPIANSTDLDVSTSTTRSIATILLPPVVANVMRVAPLLNEPETSNFTFLNRMLAPLAMTARPLRPAPPLCFTFKIADEAVPVGS